MTRLLIFLIAFVSIFRLATAFQNVESQTVIICLRQGAPSLLEWTEQGRTGSIATLDEVIGSHTTEPYIQTSTLTAVARAQRIKAMFKTKTAASLVVARFVVVHYSRDLDPFIVARKLASLPDIESAEPMPVQYIVGMPNDPDIDRQYHLELVKAFQAWDLLPTDTSIVLAVVDTGVDTTHVDLGANIWHNAGEMGLDNGGADKRFNEVDDDGNGFVDDWFGWDFVGATNQAGDNSPLPGHPHGTHVSGIAAAVVNNATGGAGVGRNIRVMAVKIGKDDPFSESVSHSADGILYAASMGALVINCSFGSSSPTFAEISVMEQATALGSLIVAAAGNDGMDQAFYPAAYPQVMSVGATDKSDKLAFFSNRHGTIDVCAPGVAIYSTFPGNTYGFLDGTSMASPVAAAIAAMVRLSTPRYSPRQVMSAVMASCDNIDSINGIFTGRYGIGRVNAFRSIANSTPKWAAVVAPSFSDANGNTYFEPGERLRLTMSIRNDLSPLSQAIVVVTPAPAAFSPVLSSDTIAIGPLAELEQRSGTSSVVIDLPNQLPYNGELRLIITIYDGTEFVSRESITAIVNPTFRTLNVNDLATTINSSGNIGYNDYPSNIQGVGLSYKGGPSILFEGALMIGVQPRDLPNVARGGNPSVKDTSFHPQTVTEIRQDSTPSGARVTTSFTDVYDPFPIGLLCTQNVYALTADSVRNALIIALDIYNRIDSVISDLYVSQFYDFDIGPAGASNGCAWDAQRGIGLLRNTLRADLPFVAVAMVSPLPMNFFAIDNDGDGTVSSPNIYDNFLRSEKWMTMAGGVSRKYSRITDVSTVIGAGPFSLAPGQQKQVCFVIAAGESFDAVSRTIESARAVSQAMGLNATAYAPLPALDGIIYLEGAPLVEPGEHGVRFSIGARSPVTIELIDLFGRTVSTVLQEPLLLPGTYSRTIMIPSAAQGTYFLRLTTYLTSSLTGFGLVR